jgi:formylglycine-generating enzyme required for sulfatase activity
MFRFALAIGVLAGTPAFSDIVEWPDFSIDRTEVTVGAFANFAFHAGLKTDAERAGGGFEWGAGWERRAGWTYRTPYGAAADPTEPAVHVSWYEAMEFCATAGGRLPTQDEWEAAGYTEQRSAPDDGFETGRTYIYPVGESPDGMNTDGGRHLPVGTTRRGVNGLHDMGANVWEWLADRRGADALTAGGSWWYGASKTRADGMQWKPAEFYAVYVGFRCIYD